MTTGASVHPGEVKSPSKLKKTGSLSMMRVKSVVLRILVRGTLVYGRETGFGFGLVHNNWIFRNGEILSQMVKTLARKYPRTEASLTVSLAVIKMPTFARCLEGRSHSNCKVNYELKHYSLVLVSWKLPLLLKSKSIVYRICSAHLTCTCERWMNFSAHIRSWT